MDRRCPTSPVLIVGAGPAGITLAYHLKRRGIESILLEARHIGDTWARVPADMRLVSPWWTNALRTRDAFHFFPLAKVRAGDFRRYLGKFSKVHDLKVVEGAKIVSIDKTDRGWQARADDGREWIASFIVLATGYFSNPAGPVGYVSTDHSVPTMHVADVSDYEVFAKSLLGKTVLIVGRRVSAGQFIVELTKRGIDVVLSTRGEVEFRRAGLLGWIRDHIYFFWEALRIRLQPDLRTNSYPIMDGGQPERLIRSGVVKVIGSLASLRDGRALTHSGTEVEIGLVLFATGYLPAVEKIRLSPGDAASRMGSTPGFYCSERSGLYMLGLDQQRNFRSRYLRGIRSDARGLAKAIAQETK
jgi:hypothetical protein